MKDFDINIGFRIRTLREKHGYSREKFSEMANIGAKFLYEIECGKKGMSAFTLYNIANALNVSSDYILTGNSAEDDLEYIKNIVSTIPKSKQKTVESIIEKLATLAK